MSKLTEKINTNIILENIQDNISSMLESKTRLADQLFSKESQFVSVEELEASLRSLTRNKHDLERLIRTIQVVVAVKELNE